ncbi:hypothetical protein P7L68_08060 [Tistrella mobilis]|uniref:hypothetical protein n=1 Tax=Tistrella mobilis TaxID=171437 RepID=UPI003557CD80
MSPSPSAPCMDRRRAVFPSVAPLSAALIPLFRLLNRVVRSDRPGRMPAAERQAYGLGDPHPETPRPVWPF